VAISPQSLHGDWIHSHEEDTDREMVFRPADRELPPSRGRRRLALRPDGTFSESAPGPTDQPQRAEGSWRLEAGERLVLAKGPAGEPDEQLSIASAERDRLVVRK
jgi:hypothetical protein